MLVSPSRDSLDAAGAFYNRVDEGVHRLVMLSNKRIQELELVMEFEKVEECFKEVRPACRVGCCDCLLPPSVRPTAGTGPVDPSCECVEQCPQTLIKHRNLGQVFRCAENQLTVCLVAPDAR